jgi:predicted amidohydrolase
MSADTFLDIALLHLKIVPGAVEHNRRILAALAEQAAGAGADVIVAPELAVSGYLTDSRQKVCPYVEPLHGPTCELLSSIASRYRVYVCAGFAEVEPGTGIFYNSALVISPLGTVVAHHRKVLSERRWASPGSVTAKSHFDSPWGRIGLLICADSWYGLLPRAQALDDVELLLVLANWPDCGLDPRELWRARALENGIPVIACNRTGAEPTLDFSSAHSYAVSGDGVELANFSSPDSAICRVKVPLCGGYLNGSRRRAVLARRDPETYGALSLNMNGLADFSGMWELPKAGALDVICTVGDGISSATLRDRSGGCAAIAAGPELRIGDRVLTIGPDRPVAIANFGPARLALVDAEWLRHPELSVALSKEGCDIVIAATRGSLSRDDRLVLGVKSLDRLAVVTLAANGATICTPPIGHERWGETVLEDRGECHCEIDTTALRRKHFEDRVNLPLLLAK